MANSLFASWLITIFLTLASTHCSRLGFWGGERTDLNCVCSQTSRPSICAALFKSDPRSSTADIRGLTKIAIDLAYNKVIYLNSPSSSGSNPGYTNIDYNPGYSNPGYTNPDYNSGYNNPGAAYGYVNRCPKYYTKVTEYIEKARDYFNRGEYGRITSKAKNALKEVEKCTDSLGGNYAGSEELGLLVQMVLFSSMRLN